MNKRILGLALAGALATSAAVMAAVTFDAATGTGFVGKGDVQLVFGWNNKQLQDNADSVQFQATSEVVTEVSWICTNSNNQNIQARERTTTISVQGLVEHATRDRNQITGFNIVGYDGEPVEGTPTTEGPAIDSCPSGPWTLTMPAGDAVLVGQTGGLQVSTNGTDWFDIE
jgi:hypothetical protein